MGSNRKQREEEVSIQNLVVISTMESARWPALLFALRRPRPKRTALLS